MSIFNIFNKKKESSDVDSLNHLNENGELPWGWLYANKEFLDKIENEYSYFRNLWSEQMYKSPKELKPALKSFIIYLQDAEKLCQEKGECFDFWFHNILVNKEFLLQRQNELKNLEVNFNQLQNDYENKQNHILELQRKIQEMKPIVIQTLIENNNMLQSEFWKLFNSEDQDAVKEIVYSLRKEGKIERTKSGRSFIIHYTE